MTTFLVIRFFGVIVAVAETPYTMDQCRASTAVLELPAELVATAECVEGGSVLKSGTLTPDQKRQIDEWTRRREAEKERVILNV